MIHRPGGTPRAALVGLVAVVVLALAGCSSGGSTSSAPSGDDAATTTTSTSPAVGRPPEGFQAVTLVVTLADGSTREWCVWLADTAERRGQGLMGVTDPGLGGAAAMVFAFPDDTATGFWMKDTVLPLSIAWYAADGTFVADADMEPCPVGVEQCPVTSAGARYRYAVEVAQGGLEPLGAVAGSTISLGSACSPGGVAA